jgi:hypothetical protein
MSLSLRTSSLYSILASFLYFSLSLSLLTRAAGSFNFFRLFLSFFFVIRVFFFTISYLFPCHTFTTANVNVYVHPSLSTTTDTTLPSAQPITYSQFTAGLAHLYKVSHVAGLDLELMPEIGQFLNTGLLLKIQGKLWSKRNGLVVLVAGVDRDGNVLTF